MNNTREQAVLKAAMRWWKSHRPINFRKADHLRNPTISVCGGREAQLLALAIARLASGGK
jgi:hypothetical protein